MAGGTSFSKIVGNIQALFDRLGRDQVEGALDHFAQVEGLVLQVHLPGFDLAEVQDVVDDGQQGITAVADDLGELALFLRSTRYPAGGRSCR